MNQSKECKQSPEETHQDEELIDTLIAISVVSKRLASKLKEDNTNKEDNPSEQRKECI